LFQLFIYESRGFSRDVNYARRRKFKKSRLYHCCTFGHKFYAIYKAVSIDGMHKLKM